MIDDVLNPKFVHRSAVTSRDLDALGRLSKDRLVAHVDGAIGAWGCPRGAVASDLEIEYLEPVIGAQILRIDLWVERMAGMSCTYGFTCSSENGNVAFARGERTVVSADSEFRARNIELLKDLPAYA